MYNINQMFMVKIGQDQKGEIVAVSDNPEFNNARVGYKDKMKQRHEFLEEIEDAAIRLKLSLV